jgi:hypothetical protein
MKTCLTLATWLVLTGCSQEGSKSAVSRKSESEKSEMVNRREAVRWAFANKREIETAIFQWSRDMLEESRKAEALSPETEDKIRRYESLQAQLMRKQMEMRGLKLPTRMGAIDASSPNTDILTLSNQVAEAKAPIADVVERRSRQGAQLREQYKVDRLISEYAKDRFDLVVDSSDERFSHSAVLYRTSGEVLDVTEGVIKLFKERTKS